MVFRKMEPPNVVYFILCKRSIDSFRFLKDFEQVLTKLRQKGGK